MARPSFFPKSINYNVQSSKPLIVKDLIVNGDAEIDGDLTVGGTTNLATLNAAATAVSSLTTTTTAIVGTNLSVGGNLSVDGTVTLSSTTGTTIANLIESSAGIRSVTQEAFAIAATNKIINIRSTGAGGPFVITPTDLGAGIFKVTIVMTAFNTSEFTMLCTQGTVHWGAVGDVASFIGFGTVSTSWSLMGAPQGCT